MFDVLGNSESPVSSLTGTLMPFGHLLQDHSFLFPCTSSKTSWKLSYSTQAAPWTKNPFLDTGAPRAICSHFWLIQTTLDMFQNVDCAENTAPFRFSGHSLCEIYVLELFASIIDIQTIWHIMKVFVYVIRSTLILCLLDLMYQRRLNSDICLREKYSNHLRLTSFAAAFHWWSPQTAGLISIHCINDPPKH